jgi:hypothetical protein
VPTQVELSALLQSIFGDRRRVNIHDILGMASLLDQGYIHEHECPVLSLLSPKVDIDKRIVQVNCEGLNVINILLSPQEVDKLEVSVELINSMKCDTTTPKKIDFLFNSLQLKTSTSPSTDPLKLVGTIGSNSRFLKDILKDSWSAVSYSCNLPMMWLMQPMGFCLRKKKAMVEKCMCTFT